MKINFLVCLFFVLSLGSTLAQSADEAAIRTAIEAESAAYHTNSDRSQFISFWQLTPEARLVYSSPSSQNTSLYDGKSMQAAVAAGQLPAADQAAREFTNYLIKASGSIGWATFDQKTTTPDGKVSYTHEIRCMEKIGGAWKIVSSSVHQYQP
jgi:Domain of unknown function (DUF4440)